MDKYLFQNIFNLRRPSEPNFATSSKLQPCLLKQPLRTQKRKLKELETTCKNECISVFLDLRKVAGFR